MTPEHGEDVPPAIEDSVRRLNARGWQSWDFGYTRDGVDCVVVWGTHRGKVFTFTARGTDAEITAQCPEIEPRFEAVVRSRQPS